MATKSTPQAKPTNIVAYLILGTTVTSALAVLIPEFKKKKPNVAVIDAQAQGVAIGINAAFGTKIKSETVSACVAAVMQVLADAK